jgi:mono/diheme cytochrome c family protein
VRPGACVALGVLAGLLLCGCGGGPSGRAVYESEACPQCHGLDMRGTERGPSLTGVGSVWKREDLKKYIGNPPAYLEHDERLRSMRGHYSLEMPVLRIEERRLDQLVEFLLTEK